MSDIEGLPGLPRYREVTIDTLTKAYADDLISVEEFERRVERAQQSSTYRDLEALLADLPSEYRRGLPAQPTRGEGPPAPQPSAPPASTDPRVFAVLSEREVGSEFFDRDFGSAVAVMGSLHVDLTDWRIPANEPVLHVFGLMSDIKISVPPDVHVELQLTPVLADVKQKGQRISRREASQTLRVTGMAVMSDVKVIR
jgi:hypothetical protein